MIIISHLYISWNRACAALDRWHLRARGRRELARLDSRRLRDIGLSHHDAVHEARKPFWQA